MPRKKLFYIPNIPYHVCARSNNKEWFYLSQEKVWEIFVSEINRVFKKHKAILHAFVLMNNHYHMLMTTHEQFPLGEVMQDLQKSVSRRINKETSRINHVFGGPYKAALIRRADHYLDIFKYVYLNPVTAGIVAKPELYFYSTLTNPDLKTYASLIPVTFPENIISWLNEPMDNDRLLKVRKGLKKTEFKVRERTY